MSASSFAGKPGERPAAPVEALRRFARKRESERSPQEVEHCEMCSEVIPADHRHLLDLAKRALVCACQACALLFSDSGSGKGKYRLIPRRYLSLVDFQMTSQQWDELRIPVNMAFLFYNTEAGHMVAFYPSPAGATESLLDLEGWEMLVQSNPVLRDLVPDVEALLINRVKDTREHYIVPIDACYQLVGLIRTTWRGLSGGEEAKQAMAGFFEDVRKRSLRVDSQLASQANAAAGQASTSAHNGKGEHDAGPKL